MLRSTTRNLLLATCFAAVPAAALAQSPSQQNQAQQNLEAQRGVSQMSGKFFSAPQPGQMRTADLRDADIYTSDNQKVGDIDDVLLNAQGQIVAVVVGVGGFLGIGEKKVAIPFESLDFQNPSAATASDMRSDMRSTTATGPATTSGQRMTTDAVPGSAATDQDRQRATAQRAEDMSQQQADRQQQATQQRQTTTTTTTTATPQRTAQATTGIWKPERILLMGLTKADLESAPEFNWDDRANRAGSTTTNAPSRNP